jgi:hypothetical protein
LRWFESVEGDLKDMVSGELERGVVGQRAEGRIWYSGWGGCNGGRRVRGRRGEGGRGRRG